MSAWWSTVLDRDQAQGDAVNRPEWQSAKYGMYLESPYNADFIEALKKEIPPDERKWDSKRNQWWISDAYLDEVDDLLRIYFSRMGYGRSE